MNDVIILEKSTPLVDQKNSLQVFTEQGALDPILERIAKEARSFVPDTSTAKGRKEITSVAFKIAQTKTYLDGLGKELVADMKELPKKIDASRKSVREYLDNLRDEIRKPLDDWEAEQARIEAETIAAEKAAALSKQIEADHEIALLLNDAIDRKREDDARRIEQERIEREAQIRAEAEQKAKLDAEREVLEAKLKAERAEREKIEAEQRAKDAERQSTERAQRAEQEAIERERKRVAHDAEVAAQAQAARDADVAHRKTINRSILSALMSIGVSEVSAKAAIVAIASGKIEHVKITY